MGDTNADWFAAGLCLSRLVPAGSVETSDRVGPWILATISERLVLPPVGMVADLGALLFGASLDALRAPHAAWAGDPELAASMRRYEDALLGRLAAEPRLAAAGFAVARLPRERHAQAVAILVAAVLSSTRFDGGRALPSGTVRALTERTPGETVRRGFASLRDDRETRRALAEDYAGLARGARMARELLRGSDLFTLENLEVLGTLGQRLAIADVVDAADAIAEALPKRIVRRRRREGASATRLPDESVYPAGGFASISTSGSLENLVASELVYMNPPSRLGPLSSSVRDPNSRPGLAAAQVDLFDVRYVEGELLYYTRDEAIHVRQRRLVLLAIDPSVASARVKDPHTPWQRLVVMLGVLLVLIKQLAALLGEESLAIEVLFLRDDEGLEPLAEERRLVELLLREWIEKGMLRVAIRTWAHVLGAARDGARTALVEVVRMAEAPLPEALRPDARAVFMDLLVGSSTIQGWCIATTDLLSALL
jgi:hypothetical protein